MAVHVEGMQIGNLSVERSREIRRAGPMDVVNTTWTARLGGARWIRSRPTRLIDLRTGKTKRVGRTRHSTEPGERAAIVRARTARLLNRGRAQGERIAKPVRNRLHGRFRR